ncbi:endonuclease/exonuclease/phosphatase family protein [Streptomyces sp. NPDC093990]|uniref:endonuclease/exonuclease/phosphatase family protein n=1 Tax=Streptomyces sp. NPDC093990 TaxID=3155306 RepID=UPI00344357A0
MASTLDTPSLRPAPPPPPEPGADTGVWRRGRIVAAVALLAALLMLGHAQIPNRVGNLGSLIETFLPWTGLAVPLLLLCALVRRSATAAVAVLLPAVIWCSLFGRTLIDKQARGGDLTVVTHNVNEHNPHPARTARALAASGADVVALEELGGAATQEYVSTLARAYPYHSVQGTVGLWSRYPIAGTRPVDISPWTRALRTTVHTRKGPVAVFVAHLMSVRFTSSGFSTDDRNAAARRLGAALRAETLPRIVLVGDFNGTLDDRALSAATSRLRSAQSAAGAGFGLTWPASFPVVRIDQILVRGVDPRASWTLPATGSDHLPVAARLGL